MLLGQAIGGDDYGVARDTELLESCERFEVGDQIFYMTHNEEGNTTFLYGSPGSIKTLAEVQTMLSSREGVIWLQGHLHGFALGGRAGADDIRGKIADMLGLD